MINPDLFKHLEEWTSIGDVLATVTWREIPGPDERYDVDIVWRFRGDKIGTGHYVILPVFGTDEHRLYWDGLVFVPEWQGKDLYTNLVKSYAERMQPYGIVGVVAAPQDTEAERRLASQGFVWDGTEFVLDFSTV